MMLGLVKIRVHKGINLPLKDIFHSDPYVVVTMGDQVHVLCIFFMSLIILSDQIYRLSEAYLK